MTTINSILREILEHEPSPETVLIILSELKGQGELDEVIDECKRALNRYPDNLPLRQLLAEAYFEKDNISEASEELEKITTQVNDLASAYKLKAMLSQKEGRSDEALEALKVYLAHQPADTEALELFQELSPEKESFPPEEPSLEPERDSKQWSALPQEGQISSPGKGVSFPEIATPTLAEIYFNQGDIPEAINTYQKVLAQDPEDESSRSRLEKLKLMLQAKSSVQAQGEAERRTKKEKMISILEAWRSKIESPPGDQGSS